MSNVRMGMRAQLYLGKGQHPAGSSHSVSHAELSGADGWEVQLLLQGGQQPARLKEGSYRREVGYPVLAPLLYWRTFLPGSRSIVSHSWSRPHLSLTLRRQE